MSHGADNIQTMPSFTQTLVLEIFGMPWFYVTTGAGLHLDIDGDGLVSKLFVCMVRNDLVRKMLLVVDSKLTVLLCWILLFRIFENDVLPSDSSLRLLPDFAALLLEFSLLMVSGVLKKLKQ